MYTTKKRYITLIEIMIVMFLIALITGVIAYNYRGSLEEGKAFKTKVGMERLETILNLRAASEDNFDDVVTQWEQYVTSDPLVKNPDSLIRDGWGNKYEVTVDNNVIRVRSRSYDEYRQRHGKTLFK